MTLTAQTLALLSQYRGVEMEDQTQVPEPQVPAQTDAPTDLTEVVVDFEGNTFTVYATSKEEGEKIIHAHIDAVRNPSPPAE